MLKLTAGLALGYVAIGCGVAYWSVSLADQGKPAFKGFGENPGPLGLVHTIVAWPYAAFANSRGTAMLGA